MKNKFAALIAATFVATFVATSASAGGFENQVFANENVKAMELSQTEMKETQGDYSAFALIGSFGGLHGAWKHHYDVHKATGTLGSAQSTATAAALGAGRIITAPNPRVSSAFNAFYKANTKYEIHKIQNGKR